jgi:hypothetical protein
MKDAASVDLFRAKLDTLKTSGLFRDQLPGFDPKKPVPIEISFLSSGNYLLVIGSKDWVDANINSVRLMAFLFERPRAHLQLKLRVVQLTGPANAEVIQMSEAVSALVDAQRDEVVRTFGDLADYLSARMQARKGAERQVYESVRTLLPAFADGARPLTVPETLLLLMVDRASPAPHAVAAGGEADEDAQAALLSLPRALAVGLQDARHDDAALAGEIRDDLAAWKKAVTAARDWCAHYSDELKKGKDNSGLGAFRAALQQQGSPMPAWVTRRLQRSLELTERLYPNLLRRHMQESVQELQRRFDAALQRAAALEQSLAQGPAPAAEPGRREPPAPANLRNDLVALKSLAEELVPAPLALFDSVALAADNAAPTPEQLIQMFHDYSAERAKMDKALAEDSSKGPEVNYARLQALEAALNLWLRRVSEAMGRSLEQQFYRRYVNEVRLLANKQLGKSSSRDLLQSSSIGEVPDVTRDLLLADTGVNIFLSNSISLQFAPDTTNSVTAQVQASLPAKLGLLERVQQASQAATALSVLTQNYGITGEAIVKALLGGGQAVPVQSGITLSASPSIGFDASTVSLSLTANETLQPDSQKVADRVTNHSINNATITALSYEPMVLSTLASNISYYESTGGIPILRKVPIVKGMIKDLPFKPFKEGKREKGVYQSSVLILEPVVIPTIEDLVRFHAGWRDAAPEAVVPVAPPGAK